ncbi:hypothetical protein [Candidatus Lucifugimonas marina]|nr:hypothetical protein [SAR202 cluster bacterium JH702]MDG0868249.1 hypothetical protein [SAR202 cluster bacterium JH639]
MAVAVSATIATGVGLTIGLTTGMAVAVSATIATGVGLTIGLTTGMAVAVSDGIITSVGKVTTETSVGVAVCSVPVLGESTVGFSWAAEIVPAS